MARILAIEPDPQRGRALKRLVHERVDAEVVLVPSTSAAIAAISERVPDVILTSTLIPPSDDLHLTAHLKRVPDLWRLPILSIPPVIDPTETPRGSTSGLRSLFRRKSRAPWPAYDHEALGARIEEAFKQSRLAEASRHVSLVPIASDDIAAPRSFENLHIQSHAYSDMPAMSDQELLDHLGLGIKRLRAHRWTSGDLPWLSTIKLPWGLDVRLLNISNSGLLIESGSKLTPGISTTFRLWGSDKELVVPARIVRSRVADVTPIAVKYEAAAVFDKILELPLQRPRHTSPGTPSALAELVERVRAEAGRGADPTMIRAAFEQGVQQMVTVRHISLRPVPFVENDGSESIYFTVPTRNEGTAILQATFEPHYRPHADEFEVLKAAALVAADVIEIEASSR